MNEAREKHLLVDGSNVLRAWPELKSLEKKSVDAAREKLGEALCLLHDLELYRITLVFDGKGPDSIVTYPYRHDTFARIFTPSHLTADDVIEHLIGQAAHPSACWVATDDRAERRTVEALGANSVSAGELGDWVLRARMRQNLKVSGLGRKNDQEWRRKHEG